MSNPLHGPFTASHGYVFSGPDNFMFAQIRGWGRLQYGKDAEKTQDAHLQFLVDALNEKVARDLEKNLLVGNAHLK